MIVKPTSFLRLRHRAGSVVQARQLRVDANNVVFHNVVRCYWMSCLLEKMAVTTGAHPHQVDPALPQSVVHIADGMAFAGASSSVHGGDHHNTSNNNALNNGGYRHHGPRQYPVDPNPSTRRWLSCSRRCPDSPNFLGSIGTAPTPLTWRQTECEEKGQHKWISVATTVGE
jgi:hypothetical protein